MDANEYICQDFEKDRIIEDYSFEVFWKDDITASVNVHGDKVRVTRSEERRVGKECRL